MHKCKRYFVRRSLLSKFFLIADIQLKGADGIFRGQSQRHYDFRTGDYLGKNDHIVEWKNPAKPEWMDQEAYEIYPDQIHVFDLLFHMQIDFYYSIFLKIMLKELLGASLEIQFSLCYCVSLILSARG